MYGEKQVATYALNKPEKTLLSMLDGKGAAQPAVVAPRPISLVKLGWRTSISTGFKPDIATLPNLLAFSSPAGEQHGS